MSGSLLAPKPHAVDHDILDVQFTRQDFACMMETMFLYGSLWIYIDHLEAVRKVMIGQGQDIRAITKDISSGYQQMGFLYVRIQSQITPFRLVLGHSHTQCSMVVEEEMD